MNDEQLQQVGAEAAALDAKTQGPIAPTPDDAQEGLRSPMTPDEASRYLDDHHYSSKHLFHPIRPLFSLSIILFLLVVGAISMVATHSTVVLSGFIFATVFLCSDDIVMAPALQSFKYWTHAREGHKKAKSYGGLLVVLLAAIGGALMGYFLLSGHQWVMQVMQMIVKDLETNMTVMVAFSVASGLLAKKFNASMPLCFVIVFLGTSLPVWLARGGIHMQIPLLIDITIMTAVLMTFLSMIIYKQAMRGYHKLRYGHTNADGYFYAVKDKVYQVDQDRAETLGKTAQVIKTLRLALRKVVQKIKEKCNFMEDVCGGQMAMTEPYKDIHYLLMSKTGTKEALNERLAEYQELYDQKEKAIKTVSWTEIPVWKIIKRKSSYRLLQLKRKCSQDSQTPSSSEEKAKQDRDILLTKVNFLQSMNATPQGRCDYKKSLHRRGLESSLAFARDEAGQKRQSTLRKNQDLRDAQDELYQAIKEYKQAVPSA